jgi:lipopolysaccharide biosynthesis glycosyltransferase
MKKIPVIFAINNDYVKQLSVAMISILKNSKSDYEFNILTTNISNENKKVLSDLGKNVNFIDMNKVLENFDLEKFMSRRRDYEYISIETYFRFFIPELFPQYDKVLYLDADILALDDLKKFYDEDISKYYAGVVQDMWIEEHLQKKRKVCGGATFKEHFLKKLKKKTTKYFNAGILLLNLNKMRADSIVDELWRFTREESPLHFQDQDVLNAVFEGNVRFIDLKWNLLKDNDYLKHQLKDKTLKRMIEESLLSPGIVHYVGSNKPWGYAAKHNYKYSFLEDWWDYYKLSPYYQAGDNEILEAILNSPNSYNTRDYFDYFCLRVFNKDILLIAEGQQGSVIRIVLFNLLKTHIRLKKKPKQYTERSI